MALWGSSEQEQPLLPSLSFSPPLNSRGRRKPLCRSSIGLALAFISTAVLSGAFVALILTVFGESGPDHFLFRIPLRLQAGHDQESSPPELITVPSTPVVPEIAPSPHGAYLEELNEMVGRTKGFFVRDYSLGLGWNNVCCRMFICVSV